MNTAMASFNTAMRHMTEMFQWPKCLSKNMSVMCQWKKARVGSTCKCGIPLCSVG